MCTLKVFTSPFVLVFETRHEQVELNSLFFLSCRFDSLTIRNGSSGNAPLLGRYCGTTFPSVITSTVSSMFVQFVSDRSLAYRGFNASYELIGESILLQCLPVLILISFQILRIGCQLLLLEMMLEIVQL